MVTAEPLSSGEFEQFLALSRQLTGFPLLQPETLTARAVIGSVSATSGLPQLKSLIAAFAALDQSSPQLPELVDDTIMARDDLAQVAMDLIAIWYTGDLPPGNEEAPAAEVYLFGQMWAAFGAKPMGVPDDGGCGSWATPPKS